MGGLGIGKPFYYGEDEFNVELDDDLEVKIVELIQIKQREEESVEIYTYCFDTCAGQQDTKSLGMFDKTDVDEISHEAKIVEHEIEITIELEKAKMDEVENSSDGLLDWFTIIGDRYLEKYDDKDMLVIENELQAIDRSKTFEHCQESPETRHVNGTCKVDQSSTTKLDYDKKLVDKGFNIGMNMVENYYENEILVENIEFRMFINIRSAHMVNANGIIIVGNCYRHGIDDEKNTQIGLHNDRFGNIDHIGMCDIEHYNGIYNEDNGLVIMNIM
ncbi:hypothetical protein C2G38_2204490 [Gigaspora rosea]|uniref:Uncharacterized protein n=1 Tax=Gigaspora rosea TaxID=44941 RepID=A0A397UQH9_9GLOM|nr:hypothetical protein C2G38_2204490 [Gigaspora rosea]